MGRRLPLAFYTADKGGTSGFRAEALSFVHQFQGFVDVTLFHRLLNTIVEVGFGIAEHRFAFGGRRRGGGWRGYRRRGVADGYRTRAGGAEQRPYQHAGSAISFHFQLQHAIGGMFSDRIRDIRGRIAGAFGIGFRRIQQGRGLLEIFQW